MKISLEKIKTPQLFRFDTSVFSVSPQTPASSPGHGERKDLNTFMHDEDFPAGFGFTLMHYNQSSTSVTQIDGGDGINTLEISHSVGSFGEFRGDGRAFSGEVWFDELEAPGIQNIQNLLVSDRFDRFDFDSVYVDFDALDRNNPLGLDMGTNKIGGEYNFYEVTNNDVTILDNSVVFISPDYDDAGLGDDDDWATDLVLTGGTGFTGTRIDDFLVGDVTVTLEDYGPGYDDITQRVFVQNLGRSDEDLFVASLTINDDTNDAVDNALQDVVIYSMGTSMSNSNIIGGFVSEDIETLFIVNDDLDQVDGTAENAPYNDGDLADEDL